MNSRAVLFISITLNLGLVLSISLVWSRNFADLEPLPAGTPLAIARPAPRASRSADPVQSTPNPPSQPFHWRQVESEDYRQYIANLRSIGCPERLIRDVILADLAGLYLARHNSIQRPLFHPWSGSDQREAAQLAHTQQHQSLRHEQSAVTAQLLGFPWTSHSRKMLRDGTDIVLLSHLTADQSWQLWTLFDLCQDRRHELHRRSQGIILAEDRADLDALNNALRSQLATLLNPAQLDELLLRMHWAILAHEFHFELANLVGTDLRSICQLHRQRVDAIAEELIHASTPSEEERNHRELAFDADILALLGPAKFNDFKRAGDDRFLDFIDFTEQHQLPRQTAISAYEIRVAAEEEARRANQILDPSALHAELGAIQEATATALTLLLGPAHLRDYIADSDDWLEKLSPTTSDEQQEYP